MTKTDQSCNVQKVTTAAARGGTGTRARATRKDRPVRCGAIKSETGHRCRRQAGAGTEHPGVGPCANHDDGSWLDERPVFADNAEARQAFLTAVRHNQTGSIRDLVEPTGYRRRDVVALIQASPEFEAEYVEARGYDNDSIRNEIRRRAIEAGSDRLLEFLGKMRLEEAQQLLRTRFEGRLEVSAAPMIDPSKGSVEELQELRRLLAVFAPDPAELREGQRPALELVAGGEDS